MKTKKLTTKQLLAKFPDMESKSDTILEDIACQHCGNRDRFRIDTKSMCEVTEDGCESDGDNEWESKSYMECGGDCCGDGRVFCATVSDFTFKGLDNLIAERNQPTT